MPVIDDEKTKAPDEQALEDQEQMGRGRTAAQDAEIDRLNEQFYKPDAEGSGASRGPGGGGGGRIKNRIKKFGKKYGSKLWLAGAGIGTFMFGGALLLFLLGSLMLPHFLQNITAYRFANAARSYRHANNAVMSKKLLLDSADDTTFNRIMARAKDLKSAAMLEKYRPAAITRNMEATGKLDFEYTPRRFPLARPKISAIIINGERIPIEQRTRWGIPFSQVGNNIRLAADIDAALFKTMRGTQVHAQVLRTGVGIRILERIGYRSFYAWANRAQAYAGMGVDEADRTLLRDMNKRSVGPGIRGSPTTDPVKRASDEAKTATNEAMADDAEATKMAQTGEVSEKVILRMNEALKGTGWEKAAGVVSTANAIAIPLCLIFDGSVERSGPAIDQKTDASIRQFSHFASMAHQQQAGDVVGEALGAANRKFNGDGGAARANAQAIAQGSQVDTTNTPPPYAGALGDYTLMNVLLGKENQAFANKINENLVPLCQVVASVEFGLASAAAELVIGFFTGGGSVAATKAGTTVLAKVVSQYLKDFAATLVSKQGLKRFVYQGAAVASGIMLARMIVSNYANQQYNGIGNNENILNEVEAGAEATANDASRAMGGRPLTSGESIVTRAASREENAAAQAELSIFERYLAVTNPQSLLTRVGYTVMGNARTATFANALTSTSQIFNPMAIMGLFGKLSPAVSAASDRLDEDSYTRTVFGFSEEELKVMKEQETYYDVFENEKVLADSGKLDKIVEKYGKCGPEGETIGTLFSKGYIIREPNGTPDPKQGDCSPENLGLRNQQGFGDLVFRWRLTKLYEAGIQVGSDVSNPTQSNENTGPNDGQTPDSNAALVWPMAQTTKISDCFGSEAKFHKNPHKGLDFFGPTNVQILSAGAGVVTRAGPASGYGPNFVVIKHDNGMGTSYGHMKSMNVSTGQRVIAGQPIGVQGTEGQSTGDHLHFNVFPGDYTGSNNPNVNPLKHVTIPPGTQNPLNCSANATANW